MYVMDETDKAMADAVKASINNASNSTARSQQARDHRMGISTLGHCRQFAKLMATETPFSDERDKTPAFFGTVAGEAIEAQLRIDHPDWMIQSDTKTVFNIPSGGEIPGTGDIVIPPDAATKAFPQGVYDLKSKSELETIRRIGRSQQQEFQLHALASGLIDDGTLDPALPVRVADVFFDRSGRTIEPFVIGSWYDPSVVAQIDLWVEDVKYAIRNDEDASRDQSREFCASYCEFYTACRGEDTDVTGLITEPQIISAVDTYKEGTAMVAAGEKMKDAAKQHLEGVSGSTGLWAIRPVIVAGGDVAYYRPPYTKLSITKVPPPKVRKEKK